MVKSALPSTAHAGICTFRSSYAYTSETNKRSITRRRVLNRHSKKKKKKDRVSSAQPSPVQLTSKSAGAVAPSPPRPRDEHAVLRTAHHSAAVLSTANRKVRESISRSHRDWPCVARKTLPTKSSPSTATRKHASTHFRSKSNEGGGGSNLEQRQ